MTVKHGNMEAAKTDYCRCCKKVILGKNHHISLFGEKAIEEPVLLKLLVSMET